MYEVGIFLLRTIRSNRLGHCQVPSVKEMKKHGCESFAEKVIDRLPLSFPGIAKKFNTSM